MASFLPILTWLPIYLDPTATWPLTRTPQVPDQQADTTTPHASAPTASVPTAPHVAGSIVIRGRLIADALAGCSLATILVPQSIAYAILGGFPPVQGLYASIFCALLYPVFGTSRINNIGILFLVNTAESYPHAQISQGPFALISMMAGQQVQTLQAAFPLLLEDDLRMLFTLAVAVWCFLFAWPAKWMTSVPTPVIKAFTSGTAVNIATSQLQPLIGAEGVPRLTSKPFAIFVQFYELAKAIGALRFNLVAVCLGVTALATMYGIKTAESVAQERLKQTREQLSTTSSPSFTRPTTASMTQPLLPTSSLHLRRDAATKLGHQVVHIIGKIPETLFVILMGTLFVMLIGGAAKYNLAIVGTIPNALPHFSSPDWSAILQLDLILMICVPSAVLAGLIVMQTLANDVAFAIKDEIRATKPTNEACVLGGMMSLCAITGGFPICSSLSRTAVAAASGAYFTLHSQVTHNTCSCPPRLSQLYHIPVLIILLLALTPACTPFLSQIPNCLLATVILFALRKLFTEFTYGHQVRKAGDIQSCVLWSIVLAVTLAFGPTWGLVIGVLTSGCFVLAHYILGQVVTEQAALAENTTCRMHVKGLAGLAFYHRRLVRQLSEKLPASGETITTIQLIIDCAPKLRAHAERNWQKVCTQLQEVERQQEHAVTVTCSF